jgi:transposase-like protein
VIHAVLEYAASGSIPLSAIAKKHGIAESHFRRIVKAHGIEIRPNQASKLSAQQADEIRTLYSTGKYTYEDLASRYGVTYANIGYVVRGDTFSGSLKQGTA